MARIRRSKGQRSPPIHRPALARAHVDPGHEPRAACPQSLRPVISCQKSRVASTIDRDIVNRFSASRSSFFRTLLRR